MSLNIFLKNLNIVEDKNKERVTKYFEVREKYSPMDSVSKYAARKIIQENT